MSSYRILVGDCRDVLKELPDESVQCVVTSPPFWGLRDYGTAAWEGGDSDCDHKGKPVPTSTGFNERYFGRESGEGNKQDQMRHEIYRHVCGKCGARRIDRQIGLESTPDSYVSTIVEVFREVWRVLRSDGTAWINLGDSYASNPASGGPGQQEGGEHQRTPRRQYQRPDGLKPKDLVGIPFRVAFALQRDGWYLRSDIIWSKPNPMPESVRDRPTKAHEYLFLMSKSERYYYDLEAVREPHSREWWQESVGGSKICADRNDGGDRQGNGSVAGRNKRSVWTIATQPFPEAHFATFPEALVEPCVMAGSRIGDTVLDPFAGSGTVGVVCSKLGRDFIGVELNPEYAAMARRRIGGAPMSLFAAVGSARRPG